MDRTLMFTVQTVDEVEELDHLWNAITEVPMKYQPGFYRVSSDDLMRPDLISYKVYGTVEHWWVVLAHNGIGDAFNDLEVGQLLTVPHVLDIYAYYNSKKVRV